MSAQPQQQVGRDGQALSRWHHAARSLKAGAHATVAGLQRWLATRRHPDYVIELIPPRAERRETLDALALENLFQSLLLTTRDPIALPMMLSASSHASVLRVDGYPPLNSLGCTQIVWRRCLARLMSPFPGYLLAGMERLPIRPTVQSRRSPCMAS